MKNANDRTNLIGKSAAMVDLRREIERVARSNAKVLITGESGVGKEIVARAINASSARSSFPFVPVNCAGLPESLLESDLFGHVRGSFTGAHSDRPGKFEAADRGTIFLDEIGEMTLRMQGLLLRFLETGEIQKIGAHSVGSTADVRVITATNRNLRDLIARGQFREDLYYRLNVIHVAVPPLRDHREDIPELVEHFIERFSGPSGTSVGPNGEADGRVVRMSPDALRALSGHTWPGNVRELENMVERLVVSGYREEIRVEDLLAVMPPSSLGHTPRRERRHTIADDLYQALVAEGKSFWATVYPLYMNREITRGNVRELVHMGLKEARGSYKVVLALFNMEMRDYKRFLNFLRKHDCRVPFKDYRSAWRV